MRSLARPRATKGRRARWAALTLAACLVASGCSSRDEVLATFTLRDAGADIRGQCVPTMHDAPDMGLDLYFVVDHSHDLGRFEWNLLFLALTDVFRLEEFRGIGVGFAIYPKMPPRTECVDNCAMPPSCNCLYRCECRRAAPDVDVQGLCQCFDWPTSCEEEDYGATLGISPLSDLVHFPALADLGEPAGNPAIAPALRGSLAYRNEWEATHPRRKVTQVLLLASTRSDECGGDRISDLERLLGGTDKPKTYVVAIDAEPNNFDYDRLAVAGRTTMATRISSRITSPTPPNPLIDLVKKIRMSDGRCEYLIEGLGPVDYDKVNLTAASGGAPFFRIRGPEECERHPHGWYYDNPATPTRIIACEGACKTLHGPNLDAGALIQLNCPTVQAPLDAGR